jgi:hypothetical protein
MRRDQGFVSVLVVAGGEVFSVRGLRDTDSRLRRGERYEGQDRPLLFDGMSGSHGDLWVFLACRTSRTRHW